jgi:hypothetical protein
MHQKKLGPGAGNAEGLEITSAETECDFLISCAADRPAEYWLHVDDDGGEHRYRRKPDGVLCLRVWQVEDRGTVVIERTFTFNRPNFGYGRRPPPGSGWVFEDSELWSTTWLREVAQP